MRSLLLTLAFALLGGARILADGPVAAKPQPTLKVGDPAPSLKATKWFNGPEVTAFEPGKIYVVEFWATWCGPCVVMMGHLGDIQEKFASKGLVIVGLTTKDRNNTLEKVTKFVEKRGDKLGYTIAFADTRETSEAFLTASGQNGIPCSFVVGKDGKIAYIGHPLFLDEALSKMIAGSWDPAKGAAELLAAGRLRGQTYAAMTREVNLATLREEREKFLLQVVLPRVILSTWDPPKGTAELHAAGRIWNQNDAAASKAIDPADQLEAWEKFSAKWPRLASDPYMDDARLKLLLACKRHADAQQLADSIVKKASKRNDLNVLCNVADTLSGALGQAGLAAIGVSAAEVALTIDGENVHSLTRLAKAYSIAGDAAKLKKTGPLAVAAAEKDVSGAKDFVGILQVAAAHDAAGHKDKAKAAAEKAVSVIDPKNPAMKEYVEGEAKKYGFEPKTAESKKK